MRLISRRNALKAAERHTRGRAAVERWCELIAGTDARSLVELRRVFPSADQVGGALVFNVGGNNFRIVCCVDWAAQRLFFRTLLTHAEYDDVNVEELCPR
ncbi:MAG: type II toxin-antitoxin system HigB family toxin [Bryobacterales bacterium]|nr:type II toxin-antitoxin system HigB family toxin [Bryobacterales bacterium]